MSDMQMAGRTGTQPMDDAPSRRSQQEDSFESERNPECPQRSNPQAVGQIWLLSESQFEPASFLRI